MSFGNYDYYNDFVDTSENTLMNGDNFTEGEESGVSNYSTTRPFNYSVVTSNYSSENASLDYVYHYNYDDAINNVPVGEMSVVALVYGLTLVLGVLGNGLVIYSIARIRRMQSVTNIFLTSLATADLLLLLICVPIKFAKWFSFTWDFGAFLCKAVHYLQNVSVICSVLTLTAMSMERYYAICHPMRAKYKCTKNRAKKIIGGLWLLSIILATPIIYGQVHKKVGVRRQAYWCIHEWGDDNLTKMYALSMLCLILVLPFIIMTVGYTAICLELWNLSSSSTKMGVCLVNRDTADVTYNNKYARNCAQSVRNRSQYSVHLQNSGRNSTKTRKQVIKMLVMIIVLFTVCWGPTLIDSVLAAFGKVHKLNYDDMKHVRQAFALMSYFNSCVNPVVYAFMSKHWRQSFQYALCSCSEKETRKYQYSQQMSPLTNASVLRNKTNHADTVDDSSLFNEHDIKKYHNEPDILTNL